MDNTLTLDEIHQIIGELFLRTVLLQKALTAAQRPQEEEKK